MGVKDWVEENVELIKRVTELEEIGFSVTMNYDNNYVELKIRKRK